VAHRAQTLTRLGSTVFDLLVVGGGITGAGIARDAALRGMSVALIDKGDFGSGTSSRSSRLIHGGVRYLEHGHLHLVFEASAERRRLLRLAPHLVTPLPFVWPVYRGQRLPLWKLSAGLTLYDVLSLFRNVERHRRLTARGVLAEEPGLRGDALSGGVRYFDAATDDARLTIANVVDAVDLGAVAANHLAYVGGMVASGVHVARVEDALDGSRFEIRARVLVNAAGPWSDAVRQRAGQGGAGRVQGSKGAHIAIRRDRLANRHAVTCLHPRDGRVLFILPAGTHAIVGTTDTFTDVSPDEVRASEADLGYLLEAANTFFPDARLTRDDVVAAWAGIRPLMPSAGSSVSASREHAVARAEGMVSITGGKLTTYRVMAAQVVDAAREVLGMPPRRATTGDRPLPGRAEGGDPGREVEVGLSWHLGDLRAGVERELAVTLGDLLMRRTHVAFETRDHGRAAARRVAPLVGEMLGWDGTAQAREIARYEAEAERIFGIDA
jgi:glycerol-3-phosphate dehydrogenase